MPLIVLYFLRSTLVLSFYIDIVLTLSVCDELFEGVNVFIFYSICLVKRTRFCLTCMFSILPDDDLPGLTMLSVLEEKKSQTPFHW